MDPRDRADAAFARASARNRWAVTPDNATSPMDAKPTVQIPRVVVNAADPREQDPDTTIVLPGSVAKGQVPVPPQQGQQIPMTQQSQPLPHVQQSQPLPHVQPQQNPATQQSQPLPHVQQSQPLPHVQQSQPLPHVQPQQNPATQQSQPLPHVQQSQQQHGQQPHPNQRPDAEQPTKQLPGIIPTTQQTPGRRMSLTDRLSGALPETDQP